jgi:hypothetical protein
MAFWFVCLQTRWSLRQATPLQRIPASVLALLQRFGFHATIRNPCFSRWGTHGPAGPDAPFDRLESPCNPGKSSIFFRSIIMGMDVLGKSPSTEQGAYFSNTVWYWHPLWDYCEQIAPDIIPASNSGHYNDGWGLEEDNALKLADRLAQALESGKTQQYARNYQERLHQLPRQICHLCSGTGKDTHLPGISCKNCGGTGRVPHFETHSFFSLENVRDFERFFTPLRRVQYLLKSFVALLLYARGRLTSRTLQMEIPPAAFPLASTDPQGLYKGFWGKG